MNKRLTFGKCVYWFLASFWLLTTILPLFFTLISSLKENSDIFANFLRPTFPLKWENYVTAIESTGILRSIVNSLFVSSGAILLMLFVCVMGAYAISRKRVPFHNFLSVLFIAALMIPIQSMVVPIVQMVTAMGLKDNLLALSVVYAGINLSMTFFILKNHIDGIPKELDEAAMLDGCNLFQLVFRIIVPVVKPALATCGILTFMQTYNELAIANVLINKAHLKTLSLTLLSLRGDYGAMYSVIFASIIISIIPTVLFYLFAQEKVEKSIISGVIKG